VQGILEDRQIKSEPTSQQSAQQGNGQPVDWSEEDQSRVNSQAHRFLVYMLYGVAIQILGSAGLFFFESGSPNPGTGLSPLIAVLGLIVLVGAVISSGGFLGGFYVYIVDAGEVQDRTGGWPNRGLYLVGHILLAPIAALFYLSKRDELVGNDYSGTLAAHLPGVGD
jgi:hypothetical protein